MVTFFKSLKNDIPLPIRLFLGKALLFFIIWKVIYTGFLYGSHLLNHPLTTHIGEASTKILNHCTPMSGFESVRVEQREFYEGEYRTHAASKIYHNGKSVLYIADFCNGLELIVLYIGFIVCMPSSFWRKIKYVVIGAIIIDFVNIARCIGLIYLREYLHYYFDFAHHYLFKAIVYSVTILLWIIFARKIHLKDETI